MSSTNLLFHYSLTFRSSHYISSALDVTYLLVHLPSIEIKLSHFYLSPSSCISPFPSLSLSPSFLVILVLLLILFLICIRYTWNIFSLRDSFCSCFVLLWSSVMHLYMTKFLPSYFNYSKQQNGEYIEACFMLEYALNFEMSQ